LTKSKKFDNQMEIEKNMLLEQEIRACEDYVEDCIAKMEKLSKVLRFLCLLSLTCGIKAKKFDFFKREIVQTYGYESMLTLNNLENLGIFNKSQKKNHWSTIRSILNLCTTLKDKEKEDYNAPKDFSFTYNGYCPLSIRLVELAQAPGGWRRVEDILSLIPGRTFESNQDLPFVSQRSEAEEPESNENPSSPLSSGFTKLSSALPSFGNLNLTGETKKEKTEGKGVGSTSSTSTGTSSSSTSSSSTSSSSSVTGTGKKPLTLVYFLGGVTFAEISALRFLSERESHGRDYLIATTKLCNGTSLIKSVKEKVTNGLVRKSQITKDQPEGKSFTKLGSQSSK